MIILPCPNRPDIDCVAGSVGYAEYLTRVKGIPARAWMSGTPDAEAQFYLDRFAEDLQLGTEADVTSAEAFAVVDFSIKASLPPNIDPAKVIQVIDHRFFNTPDKDFPNAEIQLDAVGAAATQVTEYFIRDGVEPSYPVAAMLLGAITTHTLFLKSATTTDRDKSAVEWLKPLVPDADHLIEQQLQARADEIVALMPDIFDIETKIEQSRFGQYNITLLEIKDAQGFWDQYEPAARNWAEQKERPAILLVMDPMRNTTIGYTPSELYQQALTDIWQQEPEDNVFHVPQAWFRKQIIPLLK